MVTETVVAMTTVMMTTGRGQVCDTTLFATLHTSRCKLILHEGLVQALEKSHGQDVDFLKKMSQINFIDFITDRFPARCKTNETPIYFLSVKLHLCSFAT